MKSKNDPSHLVEAAVSLTPAKFIMWLEDRGVNYEIVNREEIFNLNQDAPIIKANGMIFRFESGVLQSATQI
jgi:anti-sigma regulatory factor (Ser/Thr protein kinase)